MNRRELLQLKWLPKGEKKFNAGLEPYTGVWENTQIIHLLKRLTFGAKNQDINLLKTMTTAQAVNYLLTISTPPAPPVNAYNNNQFTDLLVPLGETWINAPADPNANPRRRNSFKSWWMGLLINQDLNITQKIILFWHNHFVTSTGDVDIPQLSYRYYTTLYNNALGNFKDFTKAITLDVAMLRYLNGEKNTANQPDENYARELQELFTLGKGSNVAFTENDVKQAAKVLTGYRINYNDFTYFFQANKHNATNKTFSQFYNNATITGKTGQAGTEELDDLLNMIFANNEVSLFICRKIYTFFIYYQITPDIEENIIIPLAETFKSNNYEILPVLKQLFTSAHFYEQAVLGCLISSPLDFLIGFIRTTNINTYADDIKMQYFIWQNINNASAVLTQDLGDPPNVSGWSAYYQNPLFHELWINSDTISKRMGVYGVLTYSGFDIGGNYKIKFIPATFVKTLNNPSNPNNLISESIEILYGLSVSQSTKDYFKQILLTGQTTDYYWTDLWDSYIQNPNNADIETEVNTRLQGLFYYLLLRAETQLL